MQVPARHSVDPLIVTFDRSLDHGLLSRCLHLEGPDGGGIAATTEIGRDERSCRLVPARSWQSGRHTLVVDPILEDVAGNSVRRVFDRDLALDQGRYLPLAAIRFTPTASVLERPDPPS